MKNLAIALVLVLAGCGTDQAPVIMSNGQTAPQTTNGNCHGDYRVYCVNYFLQPCGFFVYSCSNGLTYSCLSEIQARYLLRRTW